jgi:CheY-like chemotaxis protein
MTGKSLLLVDDEPALLELLKKFLERQGYRVHSCGHPSDALKLFEDTPSRFDLIVTDLTLPGMTGEELIERIRALQPRIPAVIASGYPYQPRLAGVEFLQKPFLPKMLLEMMERIFTAPQSRSAGASAKSGPASR